MRSKTLWTPAKPKHPRFADVVGLGEGRIGQAGPSVLAPGGPVSGPGLQAAVKIETECLP
jgi:hypothetical protein